jgi:tetratricopeptide (TPR) repeat protein
MSDPLTVKKFIRCVGLSVSEEGLLFVHDYGEITFPWNAITHTFAVLFKKKNTPPSPLFIVTSFDNSIIYFVDGNIISSKFFTTNIELGDTSGHGGALSRTEQTQAKDHDFKKLIKEVCLRLPVAHIDKPLVAYLRGSQHFLPTFTNLKEISDYVTRIMNSTPEKGRGARDLDSDDEKIKKISAPSKQRMDWSEGAILEGQYTVQEVLRGGMGTVYIVFDSENVRFYAIKTFQERYLWDEKVIAQFIKEAEIWINLEHHPNIVQAELVKMIDGKPYIFLEYIQGTDLEKLLKEDKLSVTRTLELGIQFCEGMHYAFKKLGLIHRDIKPSNCLLTREGILKITDFGLGKIFDEAPMDGELVTIPQKLKRKKTTSSSTAMVGTLPFMAPELFTSLKSAGLKSDIYSFGIMLYNMLTGLNPFSSDDPSETIYNHVSLQPDDPRTYNDRIPERFVDLIFTCLEKEPEKRYLDFAEIKTELEEIYLETIGTKYIQPREEHHFTEEDWLNKGLSLASLNRHREAIITFDQALSMNPGSLRARIYKGFSLLNFGKILESLACLDEGMKIDPHNWELWFYKGESHWKLGKIEEALSCFDHALTLTKDQAPILGRKGKLLVEKGDFREALGCYNQALAQNPRMAEIWDAKGSLQIKMRQNESAINCLKEALDINPRYRMAWYHQGLALFNLGCFKEAIDAQQRALAIDPGFVDAWIVIGDCCRESGEGERALDAYRSALKIEPGTISAYFSAVLLLKEKSRWEEALEFIDQALEIEPDNSSLFTERAETLLHLGFYDEALSLCQIILEIEPDNEDARFLLNSINRWSQEQAALLLKLNTVAPVSCLEGYDSLNTVAPVSCLEGYDSLNSILCSFCNIKDALAFLETCTLSAPADFYILSALYFVNGQYDRSLSCIEKSIHDPALGTRSALLRELSADRMENSKSAHVKRKLTTDALFKKGARVERSAEEFLIHGLEKLEEAHYADALTCFREALGIDQTCHCCLFFMGKTYEGEGDNQKAGECYHQFIEKVPHSRGFWKEKLFSHSTATPPEKEEAFINWARSSSIDYRPWRDYIIYLSRNKYYEKLKLLASTLMKLQALPWKQGESSLSRNIQGLLQLVLGRYGEAQKSFEEALRRDENNSTALSGLGRCCQFREDMNRAREYFDSLLATAAESEVAHYLLADLLLSQNMMDEALTTVQEALKKDPHSLMLMFKKSHVLVTLKRYSEFITYYARVYNIDPHYVPIKVLRSLSLHEMQKHDDAILELTSCQSLSPDNIGVAKNLGFLYLQSGNLQKALPIFDRMLSYYPLSYELHMEKGITCYLMKNFKEAGECFREALVLNPTEPDLWQFIAAVNYHLSDFSESLKYWDKAIKSRSRFIQAWTNRGILLYEQKEYIQSQECVDKVLRIEPENSFAWICRSQCMGKLGKMREALKNVESALSFTPELIKGWILKGILEFQQKAYEPSMQSFDKATQLDNKRPEAWFNRAVAALFLKNFPEAKKSLDRALALNHHFADAYIARFVLSRSADDNAPRHTFLAQAQQLNPARFDEWAQEYQNKRNPLTPLKPLEMPDDPFYLPLSRAYALIEPLEIFDLLFQK